MLSNLSTYPAVGPLPAGRSLVPIPPGHDGPSGLSRLQKKRKRAIFLLAGFLVPQAGLIEPVWDWDRSGLPQLDDLGAVLLGCAVLARCWCTLYIAAHKKQTLVTTGPFSLCRNPLYLFSCFAAGGVGLLSGSICVGLLYAAATAVLFQGVIRDEEKHLERLFGAVFFAYRRNTPRWLPDFRRWQDNAKLVTRPSLLLITLRDGLCLFAFWPFFMVMDLARETGLVPTLLVLP